MASIVCEPKAEKTAPTTVASARVSLQHTLAEALVFRDISAASFSTERLNDQRVRKLAAAIDYAIDPEAPGRERFKGWVKIKLKDGRAFECVKDHNWGSVKNPMTRDDIVNKFVVNTRATFLEPQAREIAGKILALESCADGRAIFDVLQSKPIQRTKSARGI
jgi:2-methylcitrate dehydratase PrpD